MNCQMMRVISSPSSSTTGPATLIFDTSPLGLRLDSCARPTSSAALCEPKPTDVGACSARARV